MTEQLFNAKGRSVRRIIIFAVALLLLAPLTAQAQSRSGLGIGVMVGEPTGVSVVSWLGGGHALDLVAAWAFQQNGSFYLHADYQFHSFVERPLTVFAGGGGFILLKDTPVLGFRVPLGISFLFQELPMDFFIEVAPGMSLAPATDFFVNGGVGLRFYP